MPIMQHASGAKARGVIVYLAQSRHSSYGGRASITLLKRSVSLLFQNYNAKALDDVWFMHTNVPASEQAAVLELCQPANATFVQLGPWHFELPPGARPSRKRKWVQPFQFSEGYRHMIRFFTLGLWEIVARAGYEYVMRMDEDSWLWSPIRYNLFDFMRERKFLYAYRMSSQEMGHPYWTQGKFHDMVRTYVQQKNISRNAWLLESCMDSKLGQDRHAGNVPMLAPSTSTDHFTVARCGPLNGPYNNFFISKVSFWMQPSVQDFLRYINSSNSIYFERFNDILWHGAAMRLFMPSRRVHIFRDFAYEHVTFKVRQVGNATQTCMGYGGLAFGSVAGVDAQPAVERLHELDRQLRWQEHEIAESVKAGSYNFYHWCPRSTPCYAVVNGGPPGAPSVDAGYILGSVGLEEPSCVGSRLTSCNASWYQHELYRAHSKHLGVDFDLDSPSTNILVKLIVARETVLRRAVCRTNDTLLEVLLSNVGQSQTLP